MKPWDMARIRTALAEAGMGWRLEYHPSLGSTNERAMALARAGASEGTLVIADAQTAGKGRLGRQWVSAANANLLLSLLFRPPLAPGQAQRLTMICSLAASDAIAQVTGLATRIKWPNDLLLEGKKVAGILTELGLQGDQLAHAVVGLGCNVNMQENDLPPELRPLATSLRQVSGEMVDREALLLAFLAEMERRYGALKRGESPAAEWSARLATLGQWVQVSEPGSDLVWEGEAVAVDADGALLLRLADGSQRRVLAGDVTLRKPGQSPAGG